MKRKHRDGIMDADDPIAGDQGYRADTFAAWWIDRMRREINYQRTPYHDALEAWYKAWEYGREEGIDEAAEMIASMQRAPAREREINR